jgi:hypothetical protein
MMFFSMTRPMHLILSTFLQITYMVMNLPTEMLGEQDFFSIVVVFMLKWRKHLNIYIYIIFFLVDS